MQNSVKTIYNTCIQTAKLLDTKYVPPVGSTLNEKFNIELSNDDIDVLPKVNYYTLGLTYDDLISEGVVDLDQYSHSPEDDSLHRHIPFVTRTLSTDLTAGERENYFLRVVEGTDVYYYAKRIEHIDDSPTILSGRANGDNIAISEYVRNNNGASVLPTVTPNENIFNNDFYFTYITINVKVTLTREDILEIRDAIQKKYPEITDPSIKEIGLISGIETTGLDGVQELKEAQMAIFVKTNFIVSDYVDIDSDKVTLTLDLGGMEPHISRVG